MSHRAAAALTVSFFSVRDAVGNALVRLRDERGQGTVEYIALILLVAFVMAAVVTWSHTDGNGDKVGKTIGGKVTHQIQDSIDSVGGTTTTK